MPIYLFTFESSWFYAKVTILIHLADAFFILKICKVTIIFRSFLSLQTVVQELFELYCVFAQFLDCQAS
jgi:hypothetical protein